MTTVIIKRSGKKYVYVGVCWMYILPIMDFYFCNFDESLAYMTQFLSLIHAVSTHLCHEIPVYLVQWNT
jgi:hypothetical protein